MCSYRIYFTHVAWVPKYIQTQDEGPQYISKSFTDTLLYQGY